MSKANSTARRLWGDRALHWDPAAYDAARRERGLTWLVLAERIAAEGCACHQATAYRWSRDGTPPRIALPAIARALGVRVGRLVGR